MRRLALAALAVLAAACTSPCQELGDRICRCPPTGVTKDTCETQVKNAVGSPTSSQEDVCSKLLDSCNGPDGVDFCEWITTEAGKEACGLAYPVPQ